MTTVVYCAAHGGFTQEPVPLGGGAAIYEQLLAEWARTGAVRVCPMTPAVLGARAPDGRELVGYSESEYARFCFEFSARATEEILRRDPAETVVLVNDISEAPDFARLAEAGFPIVTIYHVDVVAYVAAMYGRGLVPARWLTRAWEHLGSLPWPNLLRLVFDRQRDSLRYSRRVIVPSSGMKRLLIECYRWVPPERIEVIGWGVDAGPPPDPEARARSREALGLPPDARVLLTLSRISPEKGQDLLLEALALWERDDGFPDQPVHLLLCGGAAYMQGRQYLRRLEALAARLRRTTVHFAGHVTGERKRACFDAGDLYVFPSRHESYGLTLVEALARGLPVVAFAHDGARDLVRPEYGVLLTRRSAADLRDVLADLVSDTARMARMGAAARTAAEGLRFSDSALRVAEILIQAA